MDLDLFNEKQETYTAENVKTFVGILNLLDNLSLLIAFADNM
jgi:hypothetical protein